MVSCLCENDIFEKEFKRWKEEDEVYSESHGFPAMLDQVRKQPYMTFVGVPGSGKSATIHHIALILLKEEYKVVPIIDIRKIEDYSDSRYPQVFVINDVVGVLGLQKQKLETLTDYEKRISNPSNRNSKVLMSCREAVFNECYKSFFSNENNTIKMHISENILNDEDKKAILQKHGIDRELLTPALLGDTLDMFPLLCKLYSKEEKFRKNVERVFTCPAGCILSQFDEMQGRNRLCYATLVLCMLNDNKLSQETLKNTGNGDFCEMKSKVSEKCKIEKDTDAYKFEEALGVMEGTYTKLCGAEYTFIHDSVFEILAYHFGSQFPELFIKYISSSYIASKLKIQEFQDSFDLCIRLREDQYFMLAERLYRDIENMELHDVFMNDVLKHPRVCQVFIEVLETKSYIELKSLFLSEQKDVSKVVSKGKRVREEIEKRDERSREWHRQEVLVNEKKHYRETTYSVRVISWVVYYGHNKILQYILKQTELNKETETELFWRSFSPRLKYEAKKGENNIEKSIATVKLSLSNFICDATNQKQENSHGDLDTVRILIKYVDIKMTNKNIQYLFNDTPLTAACRGGHMSVMKELIEAGAGINQQGKYDTPLTAACEGGYMSVVKELIEAGADINPKGTYHTPLTAACEGGHLSVVKELIEAGADINPKGEFDTPLTAACKGGHISLVKELIEAGADINQKSEFGTPFTTACKGGHTSVVKELIEAGADINLQGRYDTPLTAASKGGHMSVVKELIEAGADINPKGMIDKPLTAACEGGHISLVKELIEAGADINPKGTFDTPLTAAYQGGHMSVVKELIEAGADINPKGMFHTPLTEASKGGYMSVVKELIETRADINPKGTYDTPLRAACKGGYLSVVKELIEAGADINPKAACECGHISLEKELIEAGADINPKGTYDTPLRAACKGGYLSVVKELIEAGADINQTGKFDTPLTAARTGGHMSLVNELLEAGADNFQDKSKTPLCCCQC
ncbi:uncharacterized protein LOC134282808 [Saccostrea cucullata]|uniref:uncharacterized protein LOC134282808 n=1 Tax=Saccostrea cuccullata TaxID=36930 RepID=UPI002ED6987C